MRFLPHCRAKGELWTYASSHPRQSWRGSRELKLELSLALELVFVLALALELELELELETKVHKVLLLLID
jgi:hypothetical protein